MLAALLAGLAGLLVGSFLNACIYRLPRDITLWNPPRSFCPHCETTLAWYDNIPLLSWLFLGGKCRSCRAPIGVRYFLVELLCGIMYFVIVHQFGLTLTALKLAIFGAINLELIATDVEERILPDEFTKSGIGIGLILAWFVPLSYGLSALFVPAGSSDSVYSLVEAAFAASFGYGALRLLAYLYERYRGQEGMGMGDFKMAGMLGAFLGLIPMMQALMIGSIAGTVLGMIYIRLTGKDPATYELPFGSFLGFGALVVAWMEALRGVSDAVVH